MLRVGTTVVDCTAHQLPSGRYRVRVGETIGFRWIIAEAFVPWAFQEIARSHELLVTLTPELLAAVQRKRQPRARTARMNGR